MGGAYIPSAGNTQRSRPTRRLLVALYGAGSVLSNPLFAFGLWYVLLPLWAAFAFSARGALVPSQRWTIRVVWAFLGIWILALVPLVFFAVLPGIVLWYAGAMGTIGSATFVLGRALRPVTQGSSDWRHRLAVGAGIATALAFLVPVFSGPFLASNPGLDGNVWIAYLPFLIELIPAGIASLLFADLSRPARARRDPAG